MNDAKSAVKHNSLLFPFYRCPERFLRHVIGTAGHPEACPSPRSSARLGQVPRAAIHMPNERYGATDLLGRSNPQQKPFERISRFALHIVESVLFPDLSALSEIV